MTLPSRRLADLGLSLPAAPAPLAAYVPAVRFEDLVYTAGQLPLLHGTLRAVGKVDDEVSVDDAVECARIATLNGLAAVVDLAGDLDVIRRIVKVVVYVASSSGFTDQPLIANGASGLLKEIFGEAGRHARSAVGVTVLPLAAFSSVDIRPGIPPSSALRCIHLNDAHKHRIPGAGH